jgi:hypothetical protein
LVLSLVKFVILSKPFVFKLTHPFFRVVIRHSRITNFPAANILEHITIFSGGFKVFVLGKKHYNKTKALAKGDLIDMKKIMIGVTVFIVCMLQLSSSVHATGSGYKPVNKSKDTHPAYIKNVYKMGGKTYITADYIEWYEGKEADTQFRLREHAEGLNEAPDGYYIINDNKRLRTFEVANDSIVLMQYYNRTAKGTNNDIIWNEKISLPKFFSIINDNSGWGMKDYPYHLTVKNGKIVKIIQQFIP